MADDYATALATIRSQVYACLALGPEALAGLTLEPGPAAGGHSVLDATWVERHPPLGEDWRLEVGIEYAGPLGEELVLGRRMVGGALHDLARATRRLRTLLDDGRDPDLGLVAPGALEGHRGCLAGEARALVWRALARHSQEVADATRATLAPHAAALAAAGLPGPADDGAPDT